MGNKILELKMVILIYVFFWNLLKGWFIYFLEEKGNFSGVIEKSLSFF